MAKLIGVYLQYQNADGSTYFMATECSKEHWEKVESDVEPINETSPIKISSVVSTETIESMSKPQKRFFTMKDVLAQVESNGIAIDENTFDYHLYNTRKMPKPTKKVQRERYWTQEQIDQFIEAL